MYGSDAILAGSDADGQDSLLDDVQDLYAFFSGRAEDPPAGNIAVDIDPVATARADQLSALLAEISSERRISFVSIRSGSPAVTNACQSSFAPLSTCPVLWIGSPALTNRRATSA
jgi:hypothetical protein